MNGIYWHPSLSGPVTAEIGGYIVTRQMERDEHIEYIRVQRVGEERWATDRHTVPHKTVFPEVGFWKRLWYVCNNEAWRIQPYRTIDVERLDELRAHSFMRCVQEIRSHDPR